MKKRLLSVLLVLTMLGTLVPAAPAAAQTSEKVTLIVEVEGAPVLASNAATRQGAQAYLDTAAADAAQESVRAEQKEALEEVATVTKAKVDYTYTHVLNGFAITVDADLADEIAALPHVKAVYRAQTTKAPAPVEPETRAGQATDTCCKRIGVPALHKKNVRGQGQTIAVIDSELDVNHEIFSKGVENPTWNRENIAEKIRTGELNVPARYANAVYHNSKIPFAYSYSKKSTSVLTAAHPHEHGTHVSGIAAGNNGKLPNGSRFDGVAPEAQLIFMGTLGSGDTLSDDAILAALDDAAKLGVDAVNMSLGVNYPTKSAWFTKAVNAAVAADVMVTVASGNNWRGIDKKQPIDPATPDYSTQAAPADVSAATTVASANNSGSLTNSGMSDFSSWGTNARLELKPDITAPGGGVYSAIPMTNRYKIAYGTSMATPHIAGSSLLLRQYINEHPQQYPHLSSEGPLVPILQNLMMSTTAIQTAGGVPISPRKQGAGQVNLDAATRTPVILQSESGKTAINLKDDLENTFTLRCRAVNLSDQDVTYDKVHLSVTTDGIDRSHGSASVGGTVAIATRAVELPQSVTVRAGTGENIDITVTLDDAAVRKQLQTYRNGFFVDGFLSLGVSGGSLPSIHIPYCGFVGDWNAAPAFVKPGTQAPQGLPASDFYAETSSGSVPLGSNRLFAAFAGWQSANAVRKQDYAAISPNGDGAFDTLLCKAGMLRTLDDVRLTLLDEKNDVVYEEKDLPALVKYSANSLRANANGLATLPDGRYTAVLSGALGHNDSERQELRTALTIDRLAPEIHDWTVENNGGRTILSFSATDNHALMGAVVRGKSLYGGERQQGITTHSNPHPTNHSFRFDITGMDLNTMRVSVYDYAMNNITKCGKDGGQFADVPSDAWFKESVDYCIDKKLMVGVGEGLFGPNQVTTRAQLISILWRLAGEPEATAAVNFKDVTSDAWFYKAVSWATEQHITSGFEDGTFRPNTGLSREQLAAMLYNYSKATGAPTDARADLDQYTDLEADRWSRDVFSWAVAEGILTGTGDTTLAPADTATRAQLAAVLMRYCEKSDKD